MENIMHTDSGWRIYLSVYFVKCKVYGKMQTHYFVSKKNKW